MDATTEVRNPATALARNKKGGKKGRGARGAGRIVGSRMLLPVLLLRLLGAVGARRQGLLHWGRRQDGGVWTTMPLKGTKIGSLQRTYCGVLVRPGR